MKMKVKVKILSNTLCVFLFVLINTVVFAQNNEYQYHPLNHTCNHDHDNEFDNVAKQLTTGNKTKSTKSLLDPAALIESLEIVRNHVSGVETQTSGQLSQVDEDIEDLAAIFAEHEDALELAFEVVAIHDANYGALFTTGSSTEGGFSRTANGYELENLMMTIMQAILDYGYTADNLNGYTSLFNNTKFATSDFFPGAVNPPGNANVSYTIQVNGKHIRNTGTPANAETTDARRPTGCYLAPGSIATITVPTSLVGIGASILVGAHTWDHKNKPTRKRLDRVTKLYEITSQTLTIGNPLGGGIYINIPFENDLGILDITMENVVRSPYFANTAANQTSVSEWINTERLLDAPWTDFETDRVMIQVPTAWIYALDDPATIMDDWDSAIDAISDLLGRPHLRSKTPLYAQVDVQSRGSANFPGYPQANIGYNPLTSYDGNHTNYLVQGPRTPSEGLSVLFHEHGHQEKIPKFTGEIEAFVNFLAVPVYNRVFGYELDEALNISSTTNVKHTIDEAAISWMIAANFRLGNPMSSTTGQYRQEFHYQPRGYAKYADIVRLFGWEALEDFYTTLNADYDNGTYTYSGNVNNDPTDERILRMSNGAGVDLRPLLHFWGIHPLQPSVLANNIESDGLEPSVAIYDQLMYYKTIVPMDNATFRAFGLNDFSESRIVNDACTLCNNVSQSYYESFFRKFWDDYDVEEGNAAIDEIQNIIDLYFPDGRPGDNNSPTVTNITSTDQTCGESDGTITFTFPDNEGRTGLAFSIDGGNSYTSNVADNIGSYTISNLDAGTYDLWARWGNGEFPISIGQETIEACEEEEQSAYPSGTPHPIPGTINATHYDNGGQDIAYKDNTNGNNGSGLRQDENVDTENRASDGNVGWIDAGEWLEYTVNVQSSGTYTVSFEVASRNNNGQLKLEFDGDDLTGNVSIPSTGNWGNFTTITRDVTLNSGEQVMRIYFTQGSFNLGNITFEGGGTTNLALEGTASQSSISHNGQASRAIDDNTSGVWSQRSVTHTKSQAQSWWQVALAGDAAISQIKLFNRTDCCSDRLSDFTVSVLDADGTTVWSKSYDNAPDPSLTINLNEQGSTVKVQLNGTGVLSLAEVQVFGYYLNGAKVEQAQDIDLHVYPNPFNSQLTVELPREVESNNMTVQLIDITGKIVYENTQLVTGQIIQINEELANGFYILKWADEQNQMFATRKVIKQ